MRKPFLLIFVCIITLSYGFAADSGTGTAIPTLNFEKASYFEFGFSGGPVSAENRPSSLEMEDGAWVLESAEDGGTVTIQDRVFYVYWDVISTERTIELSLSATPLEATIPSGSNGTSSISSRLPWTLSWKEKVGETETDVSFTPITGSDEDNTKVIANLSITDMGAEQIDDVMVTCSGSFGKNDVYPAVYEATVTLTIKEVS